MVARFEVHRVNLNPTIGREIKKTRPCLMVSEDEMNQNVNTIIGVAKNNDGGECVAITA